MTGPREDAVSGPADENCQEPLTDHHDAESADAPPHVAAVLALRDLACGLNVEKSALELLPVLRAMETLVGAALDRTVQAALTVLRDGGHPGLLLVLDEVETLQRVRGDVRDKALNAIRQLIDEIDSGRYPGLFLVITGTPAFYDGPSGVPRLPPLAQRIATDFATQARFDNPRAVQLRLPGFDETALLSLGSKVRDLFAGGAGEPDRIRGVVNDTYVATLASAVTGSLGGKVGIAPRVFLKKLVGDVLDRVDQFPDFDPRRDYPVTVNADELTEVERNAAALAPPAAASPDDVDLDLP